MTHRRRLLKAGVGAIALQAITPVRARGETAPPVKWAYLKPGFTQYIRVSDFARRNNVSLAPATEYTSISTYYNDFSSGGFDVCMGSWDVFAARYQAGVPLQLLCMVATADMISIVTDDPLVKKVEDLRGKTLAAPLSTGTFRLVSALIKERYGLELGKDVTMQGVDNAAAAMTLVMANRSEGGLAWEPNISVALNKKPSLRVIFNAAEAYREKTRLELPYFGVAVMRDWAVQNPEAVKRVRQTFADSVNALTADPGSVVKLGSAGSDFPPDVIAEAMRSRRLNFRFSSMSDPASRATIAAAGDFLVRNALLKKAIDNGFFYSS